MAAITSNVGALDVQGIVSSLMQIERQPLDASQQKSSTYNSQLSTIGKLSSSLSALQTAMTSLSSGRFLQAFKASISDSSMAGVSTTSGGALGTFQVEVQNLATARQLVFDQVNGSSITDPKAAIPGAPDSITLTINGKQQVIKLKDKPEDTVTLQGMNDKLNAAGIGVNSTLVQKDGAYKLVLTSSASGNDNKFTITAGGSEASGGAGPTLGGLGQSASAATESQDAKDALVKVNGVSMTSGSNKLSNAIPGVELDLYKANPGSTFTVSLSPDSSSVSKSLQGFIDAYNQVINDVKSARSGALKGNASVLDIQNQLQQVLSTPLPGVDASQSVAYLAQVGISLQKDGTLKLDQTAFNDAAKKDQQAVLKLFGNSDNTGVGQNFNKVINSMLGPNGVIESSKSSINSRLTIEKSNQDSMTSRLANKQKQLLQQYTALNATLAKMASASSSLDRLISSK